MNNTAILLPLLLISLFTIGQKKTSLKPTLTETPPIIDGKLDDPLWERATKVTKLETFVPDFW